MTEENKPQEKKQDSNPSFLPPPKPENPGPTIPSCTTCGNPLTRCQCKHNDLVK